MFNQTIASLKSGPIENNHAFNDSFNDSYNNRMLLRRQCYVRTRSRQSPLIIVLAALLSLTGVGAADDIGTAPPTLPPIFAPAFAPVGVPDTPMPVLEPTKRPTFSPSKQPSRAPVPDPTEMPTMEATTVRPTTFPSRFPSQVPSPSPSIKDSLAPSVKGSKSPSMNPTPSPSLLASLSPSVTETNLPSFTPSGGPTTAPSLMPSNSPSMKRSGTPTASPSFRPSTVPTIAQSAVPSAAPTPSPSVEPTISKSPSTSPTSSPSAFPSPIPSLSPSLSQQEYLVEVVLFFDDAQVLKGSSEITFQGITANHILSEFLSWPDLEHPLIDLAVGTNVKDQTVVEPQDDTLVRRRRLQTSPLKIVFDTAVSFRSLSNDLDVEAMIGSAFNTDEDRSKYLNRLQSRGDRSFSSINTVRVEINGVSQESVVQPSDDNSDGGGVNFFVWIGAAAGGVAVLILAGLFLLRTKKVSPKKQQVTVESSSSKIHEERLNTDLYMEAQDDISTLGDPMYAPGGMLIPGLEKDDTVAASIVSGDYDYAKNYGSPDASPRTRNDTLQSSMDGSSQNNSDFSLFGGLGKMDNSIFSDDSSFEQQFADMEERFEVSAPSGKLGMVIDTPSGGVPVVHAIKETSVLADQVGVGDRLMSVDNEDTTCLTAMQVSKLISQKAENPCRLLVFARTRARTESGDLPQ